MKIILFIFIIFFSVELFSQNKSTDSLKDGQPVNMEDFDKSFDPIYYDHSFKLLPNRTMNKIPNTDDINSNTEINIIDTIQGFRIQLIATENYQTALQLKETLFNLDSLQNVYVIFDAPNHKVRIGNFKSRVDATNYLEYLKSFGYSDSWIVQDRVFIPRTRKK